MDWKDQVGEITERFSEKVKGVNKVIHWLRVRETNRKAGQAPIKGCPLNPKPRQKKLE